MRRKQMMIAMGAVTLSLILGTAPLVQTVWQLRESVLMNRSQRNVENLWKRQR